MAQSRDPGDDTLRRVAAFMRETIDYVRDTAAETRAQRTILQRFLWRVLSNHPRPHAAFEQLKGDTLDILRREAARDASEPIAQKTAEAALFQAESILAELEAWLPATGDAKPERPN